MHFLKPFAAIRAQCKTNGDSISLSSTRSIILAEKAEIKWSEIKTIYDGPSPPVESKQSTFLRVSIPNYAVVKTPAYSWPFEPPAKTGAPSKIDTRRRILFYCGLGGTFLLRSLNESRRNGNRYYRSKVESDKN